jgi:DNA modification methylase
VKGAGVGDYLATGAVHIGDVLQLAGRLEPQSVQCLVTSPPYFGLRDYGIPPTNWPEVEYAPIAGMQPLTIPAMTACLGLESTPDAFIGHIVAVFRALRPAVKEDGTLWVNLGDSYWTKPIGKGSTHDPKWRGGRNRGEGTAGGRLATSGQHKNLMGIPWRVAFALQADGWILRSDVIWQKPAPMPESVTDRPTRAHEYIFLLSKSTRYFYDVTAIAEPISDVSLKRIQQPNFANQTGGEKDYGTTGINESRSMRKTLENFAANGQGTRNKRDVWTVASAQFPGSHFATFPADLILPCVLAGTSVAGECSQCGRAWVRETERTLVPTPKASKRNVYDERDARGLQAGDAGSRRARDGHVAGMASSVLTTGWAAQCACGVPTRPQVVLDPFLGSGTVAQEAHKEGRRWIGFDLDERAVEWGRQRLAKLPVGRLFA